MIQNNKIKTFNDVPVDETVKQMKHFSIKPRIHERNNKPNVLLRAVAQEVIDTVEKEQQQKISAGDIGFNESTVVSTPESKDTFKTKTISFEVKKYDEKSHAEYCRYRKMDMHADNEKIEGEESDTPSLCDINFNHSVIGSDETGKSELFKPMVFVAAYVEGMEELEKCIKLGAYDSKEIGTKASTIGKAVTGISDWADELIQDAIRERKPIVNDFLAIRIITNEELNEECCRKYKDAPEVLIDGVEDELVKKAHKEVLSALYAKHPGATVVIDDFTNGIGVKEFKKKLATPDDSAIAIPEEKVYMTTKGDAKITAVGLASDVSYYICELCVKAVQDEVEKYSNAGKIPLLKGSPGTANVKQFLEKIKPEKKEEFLSKYTKRYYKNVKNAL